MKKFMSNSIKSFAIVVAVCLATSFSAGAQSTGKMSVIPEVSAQINYIGSIENQPVFAVAFDNTTADAMYVTLRDADGYVFYAEKFKTAKFYKKFLFDQSEIGDAVLTLTFSSKKGRSTQSFQITKNIKTVEDIVINQVAIK